MKFCNINRFRFVTALMIACFILAANIASAGQITKLIGIGIDYESYVVETNVACTHEFSGTFKEGDAQKIIKAGPSLLCLNSSGGSLIEALKLTKYMAQPKSQIATKIRSDAKCESACALVFMAGMFRPNESDGPIKWRVLNPGGKLGFHAPSLLVKEGAYDEEGVSKAYNVAMLSISKIVHDLVNRGGEAGSALAFSLLGDMLKTPADQMMHVETVGQAGRWKINVGPINTPKLPTIAQSAHLCANGYAWDRDESSVKLYKELDGSTERSDGFIINSWQPSQTKTIEGHVGNIVINEMSGDGCNIEVSTNKDNPYVRIEYAFGGPIEYNNLMYFDPQLKLSDLPMDATQVLDLGHVYGKCIIRKNNKKIDQENCNEKGTMEDGVKSFLYTWPSGSKTQFEMTENIVKINGNRVSDFVETKTSKCGTNPKSGNSFCFEWINY